jgi:hypothetical protein
MPPCTAKGTKISTQLCPVRLNSALSAVVAQGMAAPSCTLQRTTGLQALRPGLRRTTSSAFIPSLSSSASPLWPVRPQLFKRQALPSLQQLCSRQQGSYGRQPRSLSVQAKQKDSQQQPAAEQGSSSLVSVGSVGLFLLWGGLVAYAFLLSPNQTPYRYWWAVVCEGACIDTVM